MTARISKAIASGIGLGREGYVQHQENKKVEEQAKSDLSVPSENLEGDHSGENDLDHGLWELDDLEHDQLHSVSAFADAKDTKDLVRIFAERHPPSYKASRSQLPNPVCIPQTRPRHRTRGFVRAYAPDLENCGVDQDTFLDFLSGFEEAIKV